MKKIMYILMLSLALTACTENNTNANNGELASSQSESQYSSLSNPSYIEENSGIEPSNSSDNKSSSDMVLSSSANESSSAVESAPVNSIFVTIVYDYDYGKSVEKTFVDKDIVEKIIGYFSEFTESSIEMSPRAGGKIFTIYIDDNEKKTTYRCESPFQEISYYKNLDITPWISFTGWLIPADNSMYEYFVSLFEE